MYIKTRQVSFILLFVFIFSSFVSADCNPYPAQTGNVDENFTCQDAMNGEKFFYGGNDIVKLNNASIGTGTRSGTFWLDASLAGNQYDGNDTFIAHNSTFIWVLGFNGNDIFEIYDSNFSNVYADTNPNWVDQRGDDTIIIERSISNGWILGGNDNDNITIKDSKVSFVAAGYSDILSDLPGYIDYTPYDGNDTIILDNVDFGEPNYYYPTRPGAVESGKGDDQIVFRNGGSAYGVTGGHGNDQIIVEDDMLFNACSFTNDRGNMVACGIYGDEPYASEPNATTIAKHGNDEIILHAGDLSGITVNGGHGSDMVQIFTPVKLLDTNISGGDDRSIADGFVDVLDFDGWVGDLNGSQLKNWETIVLDNSSEITFLDDNLSTGFEAGSDAGTNLPYGLVLQNDSSWKISHDFTLDGNLYNNANVDMRVDNGQTDTVLTVKNDYNGNNGVIKLDIVLNDASSSISDKLVVEGNTGGITMLSINNAGGLGGQTPVGDNEGILVVEVHGNSANDAFKLPSVSPLAGIYVYKLVQGSDGNWYLQSYVPQIVAGNSSLAVYSYSEHRGQLPLPGAGTTCQGPYAYILTEDVKHGDLTLDPDSGSYSYIPEADYQGTDTFNYQITSAQCASNVAAVTISVECSTSQSSDSGDAFAPMGLLLLLMGTLLTAWYSLSKKDAEA